MTYYKTREVPRVCEALTHEEQIVLYQKIKEEGISFPYEALLTSLCFFHAMQPMRIVEIKLGAIDVAKSILHMKGIPDIYLMPIEVILLKEYLLLRQDFPNQRTKSHLFIRRNKR